MAVIDTPSSEELRALAGQAKAWPFEEARKLAARYASKPPEKGYVLFETGYGPSGLPHIGTFGEVARTSWVRHAFSMLSDIPTKLFAFSDDMDGLRKVPDNVPNKDMLAQHLGKPLTQVPDPFGTHESFGHHNNARLRAFLDEFGFQYDFKSSTEAYHSGLFDPALKLVLERYDEIMALMLPTLGSERQETYSPIMPISPTTGRVLQTPILSRDAVAGTVVFEDEDGRRIEQEVTGGKSKLQWKVDWAMRWVALDVDYEMSGKDLIASVELSSKIAKVLGGRPPEGFTYELFLDQEGQKISKSKGNGLSVEDWLKYGPAESMASFMFHAPRRAKRLYFDVIPKSTDEYLTFLNKVQTEEPAKRLENPSFHIHAGTPPEPSSPISFSMLLNLASACNPEETSVLWGFITRYSPDATPESAPYLDKLVGYAVAYYQDFVRPAKTYRAPDEKERAAIIDLLAALSDMPADTDADAIQEKVFEIGNAHSFDPLRSWFKALYEVLLGQSQGPRFGSFIALYGIEETKTLITRALAGEDLSA